VADAVDVEPVSYPPISLLTGKITGKTKKTEHRTAICRSKKFAHSRFYARIPYVHEQGNYSWEQGCFWKEQPTINGSRLNGSTAQRLTAHHLSDALNGCSIYIESDQDAKARAE
jgi:hypothetical protein